MRLFEFVFYLDADVQWNLPAVSVAQCNSEKPLAGLCIASPHILMCIQDKKQNGDTLIHTLLQSATGDQKHHRVPLISCMCE